MLVGDAKDIKRELCEGALMLLDPFDNVFGIYSSLDGCVENENLWKALLSI